MARSRELLNVIQCQVVITLLSHYLRCLCPTPLSASPAADFLSRMDLKLHLLLDPGDEVEMLRVMDVPISGTPESCSKPRFDIYKLVSLSRLENGVHRESGVILRSAVE